MTKAFVSYSRRDTDFTRKLTDGLIEQNMELWIDWKNIPPTVDWKLQIQKGVEEADMVLFLISPDSVKSGECAEELTHAVKNGKRILPLLVRTIDSETLPVSLKHINWIDFSQKGYFDGAFLKLLEAINTDYEWLQTLSRLQVKALEWERNGKDQSFLLRGNDLQTAEGQLVVNASKKPEPTDIQREYILESKKAKDVEARAREKQRRLITGASVVVAVIMVFLTIWAFKQKSIATINEQKAKDNEQIAKKEEARAIVSENAANVAAEEAYQQKTRAQIGEISALAVGRIDQDYNEALLYSVEAYRQATAKGFSNESAKSALLTTLQSRRGLLQILPGHTDWIMGLVYSNDGKTIASSSWDNVTFLWDSTDPANPVKLAEMDGHDVAISSDNRVAATAFYDEESNFTIFLWDISDRSHPSQLGTLSGQTIIGFTPDNHYILVGNEDENQTSLIQVWDVSNQISPKLVQTLEGMNAFLSPNGSYLAMVNNQDADFNISITLWDFSNPADPSPRATLTGNYSYEANVAFTSDESIFAISGIDDGYNAIVSLWRLTDPANPEKVSTINGNFDTISSLAISPDDTLLALGGSNGKISLWYIYNPDNPNSSPSSNYFTGHTLNVSMIAFNPEDATFTTGSYDGNLMVWDLNLTNPIQVTAPEGFPLAASWSGRMLASQVYEPDIDDYSTLLWDVSVPTDIIQVGKLPGDAASAYFDPKGRVVVTVIPSYEEGVQSSIVLWDIGNPAKPIVHPLMDTPSQYGNNFTFNPDGTILIISDRNMGTSTLWDISNPDKPVQFGLVETYINASAFSPDNKLLALDVSTNDAKTEFWDISQPGQYRQIGSMDAYGAAFSPVGTLFAVSVDKQDGTSVIELWDYANWQKKVLVKTLDGYWPVFSNDGKLVVTHIASDDENSEAENLLLWDITNPKEATSQKMTGHLKSIQHIAISPNNKLLATASNDKTIMVWDISDSANPQRLATLSGHSDWVTSVAFSGNNFTLASGSFDGSVILWDVEDPKNIHQIGQLNGHKGTISLIQFPLDGKTLLTSDGSQTILWDINPESWIKKACNVVGSNFSIEKWRQLGLDVAYRPTCENVELVTVSDVQPSEPATSTSGDTSTSISSLPLCSDVPGTSGCTLITWSPQENERDRFCVQGVAYTLYALPDGSTLTPIDPGFTCTNEGARGGAQLYTCYSLENPNQSFQANVCNSSCQVTEPSNQCDSQFGLDASQSCCAPVSTDGCVEVTLQVGGCG